MFRNPSVLVMFIIFPLVALLMTELVAKANDDIPNTMFVTMMATVFAGMGLISSASAVIAEDVERKSLRFLVIAGVKPYQYLIGTGGFFLLAGALASLMFTLIGGYTGAEALKFLAIMIAGVASSVILGMTIGIFSKNQQASASLAMPIAVITGFTPMIATFNETVEKFAGVLYTQQINVIANDFSVGLGKPLLVIAANIAICTAIFALAYRKKGLKG